MAAVTSIATPPPSFTWESTSLDSASNHSVHTPIPECEPLHLQVSPSPLSPNGVEEFPEEDANDVSNTNANTKTNTKTKTKTKTKVLHVKAQALSPLPSPDTDHHHDAVDVDTTADDHTDCSNTYTDHTFDATSDAASAITITSCFSNCSTHSSRSRSRRSRSVVRFSPLVRVKDTWSHRDMSLKEHYDYWLQDHEFLMIKQRNQRTIQLIEGSRNNSSSSSSSSNSSSSSSSHDENDPEHTTAGHEETDPQQQTQPQQEQLLLHKDNFCLRGLETGLRNENLRRRSYRYAALEEVFLEQEDQYYAGIYDDEAIAEVYFEVTGECRFRAEYRALQDRKEIESYLREEGQQELLLLQLLETTPPTTTLVPVPPQDLDEEDEFAI